MIRLDRYISGLGFGSRKEIDQACRNGLIKVDDHIIGFGDTKIAWGSQIELLDRGLKFECKDCVTLLLYKPLGFVCSDVDDGGHPSYRNLLKNCPYRQSLHVAGRLDQDTTGLVICTNDGDLNHRIISPKHKLMKSYIVTCELPITEDMISRLEQGVTLDDGYQTLPAKAILNSQFSILNNKTTFELKITEGKYHQVKRMMEAVGNKVVALHRSSIGDWNLEGMKEGERKEIINYKLQITN